MGGLRDLWLVAARELHEAFRRRSFWAIAGILLVGSTAAMVVPDLLADDGPSRYEVGVVGGTPELEATLRSALAAIEAEGELVDEPDVASARAGVEEGRLDAAAVAGDPPSVLAETGEHDRLVAALQGALARQATLARLEALGLSADQAAQALDAPPPAVERVDEDEGERRAASAIVATVLYILVLQLVVQCATGTAIEKSNRISEVLLAIVRPGALLFGKVLGVGALGLITLSCGIVPVLVSGLVTGGLPPGLGGALASGAVWFVLGIALYLTIGGALGALVERQEEAGSVVAPLTISLIGAFIVAQSAPDSPLAAVLAYVPVTSPLVMPARITTGESTPLEVAVSLVLLVAALVVVVRLGAIVYRRAIVRTGRRLRLRQVLQGA